MPASPDHGRPRRPRLLAGALLVTALLATACGGEEASQSRRPAAQPPVGPVETLSILPAGPLSELGPVGRATYGTPVGFAPGFTFDMRVDGWRSIIPPDEFGFALATPNAARIEALIGVVRPVATTLGAFDEELAAAGLRDGTEAVEDMAVDGTPGRLLTVARDEAVDAFLVQSSTGEIRTSLGGPLPENRLLFVAHPDGAFVLLLSLAPDADVEARFAFQAIVDSIDFR